MKQKVKQEKSKSEPTFTVLPNPEAHRNQCVDMCEGCNRMFNLGNGNVCASYESPAAWDRPGGCPLKSNKEIEDVDKKKINPLKASRRMYRRK